MMATSTHSSLSSFKTMTLQVGICMNHYLTPYPSTNSTCIKGRQERPTSPNLRRKQRTDLCDSGFGNRALTQDTRMQKHLERISWSLPKENPSCFKAYYHQENKKDAAWETMSQPYTHLTHPDYIAELNSPEP